MKRVDSRQNVMDSVKEYYGTVLKGSKDLKTGACCTQESLPRTYREILNEIDEEIIENFYGCGSPIPLALEGCRVLDLGCGTGRDVYLVSKLVGPDGFVTGVDMTPRQLDIARSHIDSHTKRFGYKKPNVNFMHGYIEDLKSLRIENNSIDIVISNCVINLSPDKESVFSEIFRVLKPGGELYFSDIFSGQRVPIELSTDPVLLGECLGKALYTEDFRRILYKFNCLDYRIVSESPIDLKEEKIKEMVGMINFYSMTIRAFKVNDLEDKCEDYGQVATYKGSIKGAAHSFALDDHHTFITGKPMLVCGNTASMLANSRFGRHFTIAGDRTVHYGLFDCKKSDPKDKSCC